MPTSAKETTETVTSALKSLYTATTSSLQCSDSLRLPSECSALHNDDSVSLDWRTSDNLSDLTLVIYDGSGGKPYKLHTILMAFGGRKSNYIAEQMKLQQKKQKNSHNNNSSNNNHQYKIEIYVPPLAAQHIPLFLDYSYGSKLELTTQNAPPLRYLSNRFDVRELHSQLTKFIPRDLELSTAPHYCMAADQLKDYELRDKALGIMAERMERMDGRYWKEMSPRLVRSLVQCEKMGCGGEILSEKVAEWLRCRDDSYAGDEKCNNSNNNKTLKQPIPLTDEDFYWITHIQYMPVISSHEALFYLAYSSQFPSVMNEVGPGSLRHRCLEACSGSWALDHLVSHLECPEEVSLDMYEGLDINLKVQLLENVLVSTKQLVKEKDTQFANREASQRDVKQSNDIMYESLHREMECPNMVKSNKMVILGCGIPSANGVYIANHSAPPISPKATTTITAASLNKSHSVTSIYEKEAIWNGIRCTFLLSPYKSGKFYTHYKLSVRNQESNVSKVLYSSPTMTNGDVIPEQGWEVEGEGDNIYPAPLFVGRISGAS